MSVKINSDKYIIVNGKKTFPIGISNVGSETLKVADPVTAANMMKYKDFTHTSYVGTLQFFKDFVLPAFSQHGTGFILTSRDNPPSDPLIRGSYQLWGYLNCDEPYGPSEAGKVIAGITTQAACLAGRHCLPYIWNGTACVRPNELPLVTSRYAAFKTDPDHINVMNHWGNMTTWAPYGDILSWDTYTIGSRYNVGYSKWSRGNSIYAWELLSEQYYFEGTDLTITGKPVWAYIQANGLAKAEGGGTMEVPTPQEARCNTYAAICMGVHGIVFFSAHFGSVNDYGLAKNPALLAYYAQLAREVRGLNDVLVSPTIALKWAMRGIAPDTVMFGSKHTVTVLNSTVDNWSYILKQVGGTLYLIVVNKDPRPITTSISIAGSSTELQFETVGLETAGSGKAGRILNSVNKTITDSFDGQAVHIYKISGLPDVPPPPPIPAPPPEEVDWIKIGALLGTAAAAISIVQGLIKKK